MTKDLKVRHRCRHRLHGRPAATLFEVPTPAGEGLAYPSWKFLVLLTHGVFDGRFGRISPARETAQSANIHRDGNPTQPAAFVCSLPQRELSSSPSLWPCLQRDKSRGHFGSAYRKSVTQHPTVKYEQAHIARRPGADLLATVARASARSSQAEPARTPALLANSCRFRSLLRCCAKQRSWCQLFLVAPRAACAIETTPRCNRRATHPPRLGTSAATPQLPRPCRAKPV